MLSLSFCFASQIENSEEKIISALPFGDSEIKRIRSIKLREARLESCAALVALASLTSEYMPSSSPLTILREGGGKPYFAELPYFFSLSHSDGLSVAVLSDKPIGIDLEWLSDNRDVLRLSKRFFTLSEHDAVCSSQDAKKEFYSLWTKHEALAKISGDGLASICRDPLSSDVFFKQFKLSLGNKNAIISLCAKNDINDIDIHNPYKELKIYDVQN